MLRAAVLAVGLASLVAAAILPVAGGSPVLVFYLALEGTLLTAGILFERWRYHPLHAGRSDRWERTGERFVDPTTGRLMDVYYDPETGGRDYREVDEVRTGGARSIEP